MSQPSYPNQPGFYPGQPGAFPGAPQQFQPAPVQPPTQKQRLNVYTMMLVLSAIALATACTLLYLELQNYGWEPFKGPYPWDTSGATPAT